jgi:hypothetical protein
MPYAHLSDFLKAVKKKNRLFTLKKSSLNQLIGELGGNPTTTSLRPIYAAIPAPKKLKYDAGLAMLRTDFPGVDQAAPAVVPVAPAKPLGGVQVLAQAAPQRTVVRDVNAIDFNIHAPADPNAFGLNSAVILGGGADVQTEGYVIVEDPMGTSLLTVGAVAELGAVQIARINEAFRRVRTAVDEALTVLQSANSGASGALYRRFFGAYDVGRVRTVTKNFNTMSLVLQGKRGGQKGSLFVVDARNFNNAFKDVYAFTYPNMYRDNGYVAVWIGRAFFGAVGSGQAYYDRSSDATVGTLVHELSHACFGSVDVPPVGSGWTLRADGVPIDGTGRPGDANRIAPQVSTETDDEALALASPGDAIKNADNYGQFARLALKPGGR